MPKINDCVQLVDGLDAIKAIINRMTEVPAEVIEAQTKLREELSKLDKKSLIEMIIKDRIKTAQPEPKQKDLLFEIFSDPATTALSYEEISSCILRHLNTNLKYAPHNVSWWHSRFVTDGAEFPARMTSAERNRLARKIAMEVMLKK